MCLRATWSIHEHRVKRTRLLPVNTVCPSTQHRLADVNMGRIPRNEGNRSVEMAQLIEYLLCEHLNLVSSKSRARGVSKPGMMGHL